MNKQMTHQKKIPNNDSDREESQHDFNSSKKRIPQIWPPKKYKSCFILQNMPGIWTETGYHVLTYFIYC